jgi:hypothetical protein
MNKKSRQYSVVIHNVRPDASTQAVEYCQKNSRQFVQAVEAYPKPPGHHLHLFLQYPNQRSKKSVLKEFEKWKSAVLDPALLSSMMTMVIHLPQDAYKSIRWEVAFRIATRTWMVKPNSSPQGTWHSTTKQRVIDKHTITFRILTENQNQGGPTQGNPLSPNEFQAVPTADIQDAYNV